MAGQILNFQHLAEQVKSRIFNIWHGRSNVEVSIFGMEGQILNLQYWHSRSNLEFFNIWHPRSNVEYSIFGCQVTY